MGTLLIHPIIAIMIGVCTDSNAGFVAKIEKALALQTLARV